MSQTGGQGQSQFSGRVARATHGVAESNRHQAALG
jgi:hypothetical protein